MVNKERELEYANQMKAKSKSFKTFVRGIQNENTKSYNSLRNHDTLIAGLMHFQKKR